MSTEKSKTTETAMTADPLLAACIDLKEFKRLYLEENKTAAFLARKYKIRNSTALKYTHIVTDEYTRSLKNCRRKITKYQVIKMMIERMRDGVRMKDLANKYGISEGNVSNICAGRSWKHIYQGVKSKYNKEILSVK